jgi:DNA-directed RNA polymerase specialized sigma24 family protein
MHGSPPERATTHFFDLVCYRNEALYEALCSWAAAPTLPHPGPTDGQCEVKHSMREEPPRSGSTGQPPDLGFVRQTAYDRALRWGIHDLDADDVADKVTDSVEQARRTKRTFLPDEQAVRRWVSRAVQFHVLNLVEYDKRHVRIEDVPEPELVALGAISVQPEEEEPPDPRLAAMDAVVATTPPRWREVWALIKQKLPPQEIAPILGISVRTVNKYVEHLYRTIREGIAEGTPPRKGRVL